METVIMAIVFMLAILGTIIYIVCRAVNHHYAMEEIKMESDCRHGEITHISLELQSWTESTIKTAMKPLENMMNMFNPKEEP